MNTPPSPTKQPTHRPVPLLPQPAHRLDALQVQHARPLHLLQRLLGLGQVLLPILLLLLHLLLPPRLRRLALCLPPLLLLAAQHLLPSAPARAALAAQHLLPSAPAPAARRLAPVHRRRRRPVQARLASPTPTPTRLTLLLLLPRLLQLLQLELRQERRRLRRPLGDARRRGRRQRLLLQLDPLPPFLLPRALPLQPLLHVRLGVDVLLPLRLQQQPPPLLLLLRRPLPLRLLQLQLLHRQRGRGPAPAAAGTSSPSGTTRAAILVDGAKQAGEGLLVQLLLRDPVHPARPRPRRPLLLGLGARLRGPVRLLVPTAERRHEARAHRRRVRDAACPRRARRGPTPVLLLLQQRLGRLQQHRLLPPRLVRGRQLLLHPLVLLPLPPLPLRLRLRLSAPLPLRRRGVQGRQRRGVLPVRLRVGVVVRAPRGDPRLRARRLRTSP